MTRLLYFILIVAIVAGIGTPLSRPAAQDAIRIAAVVNDSVISAYDVEQRLKLITATAGLNPTREQLAVLREQVLRQLVDERLQMQETKRFEVDVTVAEIDAALAAIAKSNNFAVEEISNFLLRNGVDISTLRQQIHAELAWDKLLQGRYGSRVHVSDAEVENTYRRMLAESEAPRFFISEIFLPVDNPSERDEIREGAQRLIEQLRAGTPFSAVAQQFSQAATASQGGELGWVQKGELNSVLEEVIGNMMAGQISDPIEVTGGVYIIQLQRREEGGTVSKEARYELEQINLKLEPDAPQNIVAKTEETARQLIAEIRGCEGLSARAAKIDGADWRKLGILTDEELTSFLRPVVLPLKPGQAGGPLRTDLGLHVIVLCNKGDTGETRVTRDDIRNRIFGQQLSMLSRRYLRDLRRDAVVELR
jgi:peptidyl-prolyl cis-trans isomerase SurA